MTGPLNRRLAEMVAEKEAARPPELTAILNGATEDLRASGIVERAAGVGDRAPLFARPNLKGETVRLRALLKSGPVVVSFFRGR
ncbi:MAG: AhpC/TSA family protein, partial [Gemmatimonadetes bacterium]|nr:AhpC/TSA family protein [Gemmatimonadota bacterium]